MELIFLAIYLFLSSFVIRGMRQGKKTPANLNVVGYYLSPWFVGILAAVSTGIYGLIIFLSVLTTNTILKDIVTYNPTWGHRTALFLTAGILIWAVVKHGTDKSIPNIDKEGEKTKKEGFDNNTLVDLRTVPPGWSGILLVFGMPIKGILLKKGDYLLIGYFMRISLIPEVIPVLTDKNLDTALSKDKLELKAKAVVRMQPVDPQKILDWGISSIRKQLSEFLSVVIRDVAKRKYLKDWLNNSDVSKTRLKENGEEETYDISLSDEITLQLIQRGYATDIPGEHNWIEFGEFGIVLEVEVGEFEAEKEIHRDIFAAPALEEQKALRFAVEQKALTEAMEKHLKMLQGYGITGNQALFAAGQMAGISNQEDISTRNYLFSLDNNARDALGAIADALKKMDPETARGMVNTAREGIVRKPK